MKKENRAQWWRAQWRDCFKTLYETFIEILAMLTIALSSLVLLATVKMLWSYLTSLNGAIYIDDLVNVGWWSVLFVGSLFAIVKAVRVMLPKAEDTRDEDMQRYMEEGNTAFYQNLNIEDNPYLQGLMKDEEESTAVLCWEEGWKAADYAMLKERALSGWWLDFCQATHVRLCYGSDLFYLEFYQHGRFLGYVWIDDAFSMWSMKEDIPDGLKWLLRELRSRPNREDWLDYREPVALDSVLKETGT
ncbi:hypothetical protein [Vibrio sp. R78045]|uniref:hypothetical protein n=1 Tax=Vibrio sp. R78045 TaxID=3093868 RepID=UPI0036F2D991